MKSLKIYLLLISIFTISVHAQTSYTWFGGEGDWEVASNWSPNGIPGFMDTAVIDTGIVTLTESDSIANLKLAGILQGTTSLTVLSEMTWTAGQMNGTGSIIIAEDAELYLRASPDQIISSTRQIYNYGTAEWDSGNVYIVSSGKFYNFGTFHDNIEEQYLIRGTTAESKFVNQGHYVKSGSAVSFLWVIVNNNGILEIQKGTANFHGFTFTNNDSLIAAEDTKVYFSGGWTYIYGPLVCSGEVKFDGTNAIIDNVLNISGNIVFSNGKTTFSSNSSFENFGNIAPEISRDGTVVFNTGGEVKLDSLNLAGGNLGGIDNILINKSLVWTGGVSSSSNLGVYQGGTVLTIGQDASFILESRSNNHISCQIDNYGTTIAKNGILDFYDGVDFNNYGTFIDSIGFYNRGIEEGSTFKNAGSFIKSADRECHMALKFENDAGALLKAYGTMNMIGGFSNEGDVSPGDSIGILSFVGDYPTASSSLLQIELSGKLPGTEYDQVKISNNASLGGTLDIILLNDYLPDVGDEFQIMTFASGSGSFDTINGLDTGKGVAFEVVQSATDVKLVAVEATPNTPPSTFNLISPEDKIVLEVIETIEFTGMPHRTWRAIVYFMI